MGKKNAEPFDALYFFVFICKIMKIYLDFLYIMWENAFMEVK